MSPNTLSPAEEQMECGSKQWKWRKSSWRWGGRDRELAVRSQTPSHGFYWVSPVLCLWLGTGGRGLRLSE